MRQFFEKCIKFVTVVTIGLILLAILQAWGGRKDPLTPDQEYECAYDQITRKYSYYTNENNFQQTTETLIKSLTDLKKVYGR